MFGASSNPFGQSSNSPFGSPSVFGQTNNANNNPFAPKPFGSTSPFGAQTGSSLFGGTSTGVFGVQASSPAFGVSSTPAFGASSTPAFGASSSPAFGASSSPAFGSSVFGQQKPAFGGFGSATTSSPFGSTFQQSQPAFGTSTFGSTPFGASSQPTFGASSTPAFGSSSTPAFGATSTTAFGGASTPAFGSTSTPTFGNTGSAFGVSNSSVFGSNTPAFGASSTPAFGASSTPAFGSSSTPAFGSSPTPAFGTTSSAFNFGSSPAFGQQSASAFGSTQFGTAPTAFGAQSSPFGVQSTTPTFGSPGFGQTTFGSQRVGSRVTPYAQTPETDGTSAAQGGGKLESISAMPAYKEKSHEELRWEDYQAGDKGGPNPAGQSSGGFNINNTQQQQQPNLFSSPSAFGQPTASNPFSSTTASNPFAPKTSGFGTPTFGNSGSAPASSIFGAPQSNPNPFGSTPSPAQPFSTPNFGSSTSPSIFGTSNTSTFGTSSLFNTTQAQGASSPFTSGLNFGNTQSSPLFQSTTPSIAQTSSPFGQTPSAFGQAAPSFTQTTPAFGQSNAFGGNMFSSTPSLLTSSMGFNQTTPSLSMPFQSSQPTQNTSAFGFAAPTGGTSSIFGQNNFGQMSANQSLAIAPPQSITNPFGTLPAMPQISIGRAGNAPSVQYGISSLPVVDKPAPIRMSSVLTSRHLSQRRIRLPARKYHPKIDGLTVPFFSDEEETTTSTPKADALFVPRENPRALVIRPLEQWPGRASTEKPKNAPSTNGGYTEFISTTHQNGRSSENGHRNHSENDVYKEQTTPIKITQKTNGVHEDHSTPKSDSYISLTGHRAGEAAIVYEHGADIETLMPKLRHSDYYTEPRIQELAAKERGEPGFCRRVKDFVVGRYNHGSIKFLGETDVRRLELESLIQFNHREVIVYLDETKKPPIGQGLNKPAIVTLMNIKCCDKKTGRHFTEGPRVEKYTEMLKKKAEDQGAEFISYDPVKGEWKFRVDHFSRYGLKDEDDVA